MKIASFNANIDYVTGSENPYKLHSASIHENARPLCREGAGIQYLWGIPRTPLVGVFSLSAPEARPVMKEGT